ncbi:hypothetical protein NLC35_00420 [Candidatus Aminicenantes bacterium AC-334-K16]|jgi:hypothetical protein|nr:hypothetical protein [Candidatus Aminicenantes bacterium AC-334-K16]
MRKRRHRLYAWGLGLTVLVALLLFSIACQDVSNPMGPSPEITSTNNTSQTTGTTNRDDFEQLEKPNTIKNPPQQAKPDLPGEAVNNPTTTNRTFQAKGTISPSPFPPVQLNTDRLRPLRLPLHEKKTPKTFSNPTTPTPSSSSSDEDEEANKRPSQELRIQVSPDAWNFNWVNSTGLVTVRIIGEGATNVDPETITLSLTNEEGSLTTDEIKPLWAEIKDSHVLAKFKKNEVITLLPEEAKAGDYFQVVIKGQFQSENGDGQSFEPLTDMIRVVGHNKKDEKDKDEYLTIKLTPKNWNPAWALNLADGNGDCEDECYVVAHFKGTGIEDIVEGSISLALGTCEETMSEPIYPIDEKLDDDEYLAYFEKSEAIGLIPDPQPGETYKVSVQVNVANGNGTEEYCETFTIKIVGKSHELTVKIKPDRWNISWWKTDSADNDDENGDDDETIKVIFKGIGFEDVAPESCQIEYGGESVGGDAILNHELDEDDYKLVVEFRRSDVINLISDPKVGETFTLTIHFNLDSTSTSAEVTISITGKKK